MIRLLVTGKGGQVGFELIRCLQPLGEVLGIGTSDLDLRSVDAIHTVLDRLRPNVIINAAAYTSVDRAESEPEVAMRVNGDAPSAIGLWARANDATVIHYSTDYVFSGEENGARREGDPTAPRSVYGRSKLAGEAGLLRSGAAAIVLRTSWVYAGRGTNFLRTMLRLAREREELRVVNDQFGAPTCARSLAEATAALVARLGRDPAGVLEAAHRSAGVYHLACTGATTWYAFARAIFEMIPDDRRILRSLVPITTADYPLPAARPRNSALDCSRIEAEFGIRLPQWKDALALLAEERSSGSLLGTC